MRVEHGMQQVRRRPREARRIRGLKPFDRFVECGDLDRGAGREHGQQGEDIVAIDGFVQRHMDRVVHAVAEVDPGLLRRFENLAHGLHAARHVEARRVEVVIVQLTEPEALEPARQQLRVRVDAGRNGFQPLRTVIHRVQPRDVGEQRLRGADVRRRLLAADVLLAGLQRHAIGRIPVRVDRHADDAARRLPDVLVEGRKERGVRAAIPERHAEAL